GSHFRQIVFQQGRQGKVRSGQSQRRAPRQQIGLVQPVQIFAIGNPFVEGRLVANEQRDQDDAGQAQRQPGNVDEAVQLVADDVAQGSDEVIPQHDGPLKDSMFKEPGGGFQ